MKWHQSRSSPAIQGGEEVALIHGWRRAYRPKNFGFVWDHFAGLVDGGRLRASIEVYNELEKKDDELFKWCKDRKEKMFAEIGVWQFAPRCACAP